MTAFARSYGAASEIRRKSEFLNSKLQIPNSKLNRRKRGAALDVLGDRGWGFVRQFGLGRQGGRFAAKHAILPDFEGDFLAILEALLGVFLLCHSGADD